MRPLFCIVLLLPYVFGEDFTDGRYFVVTSNQVNGRMILDAEKGTYFVYAVHKLNEPNKDYLRNVFVLDSRKNRTGCSVFELASSVGAVETELGYVVLKAEGGKGLVIVDDNAATDNKPPYVIYVAFTLDQLPVYSAARANGQKIFITPDLPIGITNAMVLNADPIMTLRRFNVTKDTTFQVFTQPYLLASDSSVLNYITSDVALRATIVIAGPVATISTIGPANNTASFEFNIEERNGVFASTLGESAFLSVSSAGYAGPDAEPYDVPRGIDVIPMHQEYALGGVYASVFVRGRSTGAESELNITIDGRLGQSMRLNSGYKGNISALGATKMRIDTRGEGVFNIRIQTGNGATQMTFGLSLICFVHAISHIY